MSTKAEKYSYIKNRVGISCMTDKECTQHYMILWSNCRSQSLQWYDVHQEREPTWPKVYPAPRGEIPQPHLSSGSDQSRSHMGPSCGTSWTRSRSRMWSSESMLGDSPPCKQKISDSTWWKTQNKKLNGGLLSQIKPWTCSLISNIIFLAGKAIWNIETYATCTCECR